MNDETQRIAQVFERLAASSYRRRFLLSNAEKFKLKITGLPKILAQASDIIDRNIAPERPVNDGTQTPMKGHPVHIAQHATATCCRGCLEKWHGIPKGVALGGSEKRYILSVLEIWLKNPGD